MGLFGMRLFGYNEKTYNKNSERFKQRLQNIMYNANDRGADTFKLGKSLSRISILIDRLPYNSTGKEYEAVDAVIDDILSKMEDDVREKRMSSIVVRANLLYEELDKGRRDGKHAFSPDMRQAEHSKAEALGHIHDGLNRLAEIEVEQNRLVKLGANANDSERIKLELEYNELETEKQAITTNNNMWMSTYNTALDVIGATKTVTDLEKFEANQVCNLQEFEKKMEKAAERLERGIERNKDIANVAQGAKNTFGQIVGSANTMKSGVNAAVEDEKNRQLQEEMGSAPVNNGSNTQTTSKFAQAINNYNKN